MNDYFINPIWFYLINLADKINCLSIVIIIITIVVLIIGGIIHAANQEYGDEDSTNFKKIMSKIGIIFGISLCAFTFIPDQTTCTKILIANTVTKTNVEYAEDKAKDIIDYIIEKTNEIKDKEE